MPDEMMDEMEFDKAIDEMEPDVLARFIAKQVWKSNKRCETHERILKGVADQLIAHTTDEDAHSKGLTKKQVGTTGGLAAVIGGAIVFVIDWLLRRN